MKSITTSNYDFESIIQNNNVYVDKTDQLAKLAQEVHGQFFISRPRRFGKSLMLSTLKAIFQGKRELFEGLKISQMDYDWRAYPVIHMDMSSVRAGTPSDIALGLNHCVMDLAQQFGLSILCENSPALTFENFWRAVAKANLQVVVLIDEYDIPLQGFLKQPEQLKEIRQIMHDFYVRLKTYSSNIRFLMLAGVSKFTKLSIFSGLNNLNDLTMDVQFASLLGYTHDEFKYYFSEYIDSFAQKKGLTHEQVLSQFFDWYDNYRFSPASEICVLNPVSVGFAFLKSELSNYWMQTGASSLILERIREAEKIPSSLESIRITAESLDVCDARTMPLVSLMYQAGYLTIKAVEEVGVLILGIPNQEIRSSLTHQYLQEEIGLAGDGVTIAYRRIEKALKAGELERALEILRSAFAALPYTWLMQNEGAVKVAFYSLFFPMSNVRVSTEEEMLGGRVDAVVETKEAIYIFEFKYNKTARAAFKQIVKNGYHRPYLTKDKPVFGIGLNYRASRWKRGIDKPVVMVLNEDF